MEPVILELRLRNLTKKSLKIDSNLHPEFGNVSVFVRKPGGKIIEFTPLFCKLASPATVDLQAAGTSEGRDRYSNALSLTYGKDGFYFDAPGIYTVRAIAHGPNGAVIPSNPLRIQIGFPAKDDEVVAQDYFTRDVGLSLYMGGSQSPLLESAMKTLDEVAGLKKGTRFGAVLASVVADSVARPFFRVVKNKLTKTHKGDLQRATGLFDGAISVLEDINDKSVNLLHRAVAERNAHCKLELGDESEAKEEISSAKSVLKSRGVNTSVLNSMTLAAAAAERSLMKS